MFQEEKVVSRQSVDNYKTKKTFTLQSRRKRRKAVKKITTLAISAVLFGAITGSTGYAVNQNLSSQNSRNVTSQQTGSSSYLLTLSAEKGANTDNLSVTDIAQTGLSSVVSVTNVSVQEVRDYFGNRRGNRNREFFYPQTEETVSCGSGIIIYEEDSQLYMVTNYHVVEGADTLSVTFVDDETYEAVLCGYDENTDLAVLKIDTSSLSESTYSQISIMEIGDSDDLAVGEQVVAIGNALGYGQSVTTGIVSAVDRSLNEDTDHTNIFEDMESGNTESAFSSYIQTDAAINPGNSGGALMNMEGKLVGINTAKISSTDVEGIGYAIPISQVLDLIDTLMQ